MAWRGSGRVLISGALILPLGQANWSAGLNQHFTSVILPSTNIINAANLNQCFHLI